jgi:hypothetical protein
MRILFIGDIVAKPGRSAVKEVLPELKREQKVDLVIANAENLAHGRGATAETIREMQTYGVDFFTGGDHLFWHKDFEDVIDTLPIVRPANYPSTTPGKGYALIEHKSGKKVLIINLMGQTSFGGTNAFLDHPFKKADEILNEYKSVDCIKFIDFHAEATSEKEALGFYLDGKVDALIGTHTHIPTCDGMKLPKGTLYLTDAGMTGNINSVLGVKKEIIINQFLTAQNQKFEWEEYGQKAFRSVLLDTENKTVERFDKLL